MATSVLPEPLWPAEASPAEQALWRWAIEQLPCATFKGRERPAVVLALDLRAHKADHAAEAARTAYVGATRARSQLVVVGDPDVVAAYGFNDVAASLQRRDEQVSSSNAR